MSTLSFLLARHTALSGDEVAHLQRLASEWQLLSDLSFADFLLWVPVTTPPGPAGSNGTTGPAAPESPTFRAQIGDRMTGVSNFDPLTRTLRPGARIEMETSACLPIDTLLPDGLVPVGPSAVRAAGQGFTQNGSTDFVTPRELTGVEIRPDGLLRLERETGWAVIDPGEVVAVVWDSEPQSSPGQFL